MQIMPEKTEMQEPRYVHVIVYHDIEDRYVGLDVFGNFEAALRQFDKTLAEIRDMHSDDPDWIIDLIRRVDDGYGELYFSTGDDYEVFYRREIVQNECKNSNEK